MCVLDQTVDARILGQMASSSALPRLSNVSKEPDLTHIYTDKMPRCYPGCIKLTITTPNRPRRRGLSRVLCGTSRCRLASLRKFPSVIIIVVSPPDGLLLNVCVLAKEMTNPIHHSLRPGPRMMSQVLCGNPPSTRYLWPRYVPAAPWPVHGRSTVASVVTGFSAVFFSPPPSPHAWG